MRASAVLMGLGGLLIAIGVVTWVLVTFSDGGTQTGKAIALGLYGIGAPAVGVVLLVAGGVVRLVRPGHTPRPS